MNRRRFLASLAFAAAAGPLASARAAMPSLFIEDLTWMELRDAVQGGCRAALLPTGGVEQNGPHMALGKHNVIVRYAAQEIARRVGGMLIAPVVTCVPEGRFDPPDGHLAFPGTLGVSEATFATILQDTATSLALAGFTFIFFVGDHGGSQATQTRVAARLSRAWHRRGVRVVNLARYYAMNGQTEWLEAQGFVAAVIGRHAGIPDTSELLAVRPDDVRREFLSPQSWPAGNSGVDGDPSAATAEIGRQLLELKIAAAVVEAREILGARTAQTP